MLLLWHRLLPRSSSDGGLAEQRLAGVGEAMSPRRFLQPRMLISIHRWSCSTMSRPKGCHRCKRIACCNMCAISAAALSFWVVSTHLPWGIPGNGVRVALAPGEQPTDTCASVDDPGRFQRVDDAGRWKRDAMAASVCGGESGSSSAPAAGSCLSGQLREGLELVDSGPIGAFARTDDAAAPCNSAPWSDQSRGGA